MTNISPAITLFLALAKTETILNNRFDRILGGIGFNEFRILYYINQAENQKMRRVDLAEKIGLTASGVTRLLLPMEKIGLIKSGEAAEDARVRSVTISNSGKQKRLEALERLELFAEENLAEIKNEELEKISKFLMNLGGKTLMN